MRYEPGDTVFVEANVDDLFNHDFVGTIYDFENGKIQVMDQDENVFEVDFEQIKPLEDVGY